jgi:5-methylcytosine-specific restriction endonuclease McrA
LKNNLGKKASPATRAKMSAAHSGPRNHKWNGGITKLTRRARQNALYQQWRRAVLKRDNLTCQDCGIKPAHPHVHHLLSMKAHPELKLKLWNGVTLCADCHRALHARERSGVQ